MKRISHIYLLTALCLSSFSGAAERVIPYDPRIPTEDQVGAPAATVRGTLVTAAQTLTPSCAVGNDKPAKAGAVDLSSGIQQLTTKSNHNNLESAQAIYNIVFTGGDVSAGDVGRLITMLGDIDDPWAAQALKKIHSYAPILAERLVDTSLPAELLKPARNSAEIEIRIAVINAIRPHNSQTLADILQTEVAASGPTGERAAKVANTLQ